MSIKFITPKPIRIYSEKYRARIAGSDGQPVVDPSASAPTSAKLTQGHAHWALQALAEEMAARHDSARQSEMPRSEPNDANAPARQDSET